MSARVEELKQSRDIGVTIFRAGIIAVAGVALMYLYLVMVANQSAALLGAGLGLIVPLLCFTVGVTTYARAATALRTYSVASRGILRRQDHGTQVPTGSNSAEADILRRLESQFEDE